MFILNALFDEREDKGLEHEKHFVKDHLSFSLKNCYNDLN